MIARCVDNPQRIYGLPDQPETWVDVEVDTPFVLHNQDMRTRVGWTPFAGMTLFGKVQEVTLRGTTVFKEGNLLAQAGSGQVLLLCPKLICCFDRRGRTSRRFFVLQIIQD